MFCIPISDETYRRAARLANVEEIHLAPVEDEEFEALRVRVDALLFNAMDLGFGEIERRGDVRLRHPPAEYGDL